MRNARLFPLAFVLFHPLAVLYADGGAVRLSERRGDYRITVFTAPTPLRAGPVDISVFVQDAVRGEPVPEARIVVCATPRDRPDAVIRQPATAAAAANKLFQAAIIDLPQAGWWDVTILIEELPEPLEVHFEMEAGQSLPDEWELWPWIGWPAVAVFVFGVHQWLVRRKAHGSGHRKKKADPPEGEPAHITLSPNQRDTNYIAITPTASQERKN